MQRIEKLDAILRVDKVKLAKAITPYFRDRSVRLRLNAIQIASKEKLCDLENQVLLLLGDPDYLVRDFAVECLGNFHAGESIRATWLYPLLDDPNWLVRVETLESLAQIGDKAARPLMAKRLEDENALVRGYAAICLADLGANRYRKQIELALRHEEDEAALIRFADSLFRLGDGGQFTRILAGLSSASYQVRCASAHILSNLELTAEKIKAALHAVSHSRQHFLFRADQKTMETVEVDLREQLSIR